ncbi:hypothetical protein LWC35_25480 [Pseudonocardia kujensis]|uniref:hypothetical protein n=1 Tax=Pseudonocardia kujensis TaxID=1128675 RepID=UPI001E4F0370|nr:hypothetical protein [Pseudonocardia kujensis]MCE0766230.1 hypothetical protein [Pseudonocardia kujensis]
MSEQSSATMRGQATVGPPLGTGRFTVTANAVEWRLSAPAGAGPPPADQIRTLLREWLRTLDWPRTQTALVLKAVAEAVDVLQRCRDVPAAVLDGLRIETTEVATRPARWLRIRVAGSGTTAGPDVSALRELVEDVTTGPGATITMESRVVPRW